MIALSCPYCNKPDALVKHGTNRGGTARCRCLGCRKTFTPQPNPRRVGTEKEQAILGALAERISQRGIARALKVSRDTIRNLRKKTQGA